MRKLVNKAGLDDFVSNNPLVLVFYEAMWCGPARMIRPKIEEFENVYTQVSFGCVNVDDNAEASEAEGISAMPTTILYKDGQKHGEVVGAIEEKIREALNILVA